MAWHKRAWACSRGQGVRVSDGNFNNWLVASQLCTGAALTSPPAQCLSHVQEDDPGSRQAAGLSASSQYCRL